MIIISCKAPSKPPPAFAPGPSCSWGCVHSARTCVSLQSFPFGEEGRKGLPKGLLAQPIQTLPLVNPTTEQTL